MFSGSKIVTLDISSFNTSKVEDMLYMFSNSFLNVIDISSFDMSSVVNTTRMFFQCKAKTGYARTPADAFTLNSSSSDRPAGLELTVK